MRRIVAATAALLAATPLAAQTATPAPKVKFIHAGALLAKPGEAPRGASTIVVRDGKVAEVREGHVAPEAGAELIDLKDRFVMPGLVDMHVHLWGIGGDPLRDRLTALNRDDADDMMYAVGNARVTLEAGFTTVRDLGGNARGMRALREGVERGMVVGPTIVNAGNSISVSGGHADPTNGLAAEFADAVHQHKINTCDGPDDCRRAVRQQVALGAQVIKYMSTGGVLSNVSGGLGRAMTDEEMKAIVDTAHGLGRKVATHSHGVAGTKAAVAAGVDTIDHGSFLDDEAIRAMKANGTWLADDDGPRRRAGIRARGPAAARHHPQGRGSGGCRLRQPLQGLCRGGEGRVRHRQRRVEARRQRPRVRPDGEGGHDPSAGAQDRHRQRRRGARPRCSDRDDRAGQGCRYHRRGG